MERESEASVAKRSAAEQVRANERSERPSGPLKTRLSLTSQCVHQLVHRSIHHALVENAKNAHLWGNSFRQHRSHCCQELTIQYLLSTSRHLLTWQRLELVLLVVCNAFLHPSIHLSIRPSVHPSICLSIHLSAHHIFQFFFGFLFLDLTAETLQELQVPWLALLHLLFLTKPPWFFVLSSHFRSILR